MNANIEELIQKHLAIVEAETFENIEEVTKVKEYIANLEEKRIEIKEKQI